MASPEIKNYVPEDENPEGEVILEGQTAPEEVEPKDASSTEVKMSEEEAIEEVKKIISSNETLNTLNGLQFLNEKYEANALPENIKILYEQAIKNATKKLEEDLAFKLAMKEAWMSVDKVPLLEIWKGKARAMTKDILKDPSTEAQVKIVGETIENYDSLKPWQKKVWEISVEAFKNSMEETFKNLIKKERAD